MTEGLLPFDIEGSQAQQEAYRKLRHVYEMVYDHPFVTSESVQMRGEASRRAAALQNFETTERTIPFIYGSVARGQAVPGSDLDMIRRIPIAPRLYYEYESGQTIMHLPNNRHEMVSNLPIRVGKLFYPAVGEFADCFDCQIADEVYELRKQVIIAISVGAGAVITAESIWESIRRSLEFEFLPNLTNRLPLWHGPKDRIGRLKNYRERMVQEHCGKAQSFFDELDTLSFPDWETMKKAFGVEES